MSIPLVPGLLRDHLAELAERDDRFPGLVDLPWQSLAVRRGIVGFELVRLPGEIRDVDEISTPCRHEVLERHVRVYEPLMIYNPDLPK